MPVVMTQITGPVRVPNGDIPAYGRMTFKLRRVATAGATTYIRETVEAVLDAGGNLDVTLQASASLDLLTNYDVTVRYFSTAAKCTVTESLGVISVPVSGPVSFASLYTEAPDEPTPPDVLAEAAAAVEGATVAAGQAAGSAAAAALYAPAYHETISELLASTASFGAGAYHNTRDGGTVVEVASGEDVVTTGGLKVQAIPRSGVVALDVLGAGPSKTGAQNSAIMLSVWNRMIANGGGEIRLVAAGRWQFDNTVFPASPNYKMRVVMNQGFRGSEIYPSNPISGTFLWDFQNDGAGGENYVDLNGVVVSGQVTPGLGTASPRAAFNGVRVTGQNGTENMGLQGRFVDGTAWRFMRPYNSNYGITTVHSGNVAADRFAQQFFGGAGDAVAGNDITLDNLFTEQDYLGIEIDSCTLVRTKHPVKLHGGNAQRMMRLNRVRMFEIDVMLTHDLVGDRAIEILDDVNATGIAQKSTGVFANLTQGTLRVQNQINFEYLGVGVGRAVAIDLGNALSAVKVEGMMRGFTAPSGAYKYLTIVGGTEDINTLIDVSNLNISDSDSTTHVDDQRTAAKNLMGGKAARSGYIGMRADDLRDPSTGFIITGEEFGATVSGNGEVPPFTGRFLSTANGSRGIFAERHTVHNTILGTISAAQRIVMPTYQIVPVVAGGVRAGAAVIGRVSISAGAVAASYDASNHWVLDIYKSTSVIMSLKLSRGTLSSGAGDLFPSRVGGNATTGYVMEYWVGLDAAQFFSKGNFLAAFLRPVGSPPALTDCGVTIVYSVVA